MNSSTFKGCSNLTSINLPSTINILGVSCFEDCTSLTSINIPSSVVDIRDSCFAGCSNLVDYQLYWTGEDIIVYDSSNMPNNADAIFTIPNGETSNYVAKGYPSAKLQERSV